MGKNIQFVFGKSRWAAGINKVDRDKVYGYVEEKVTTAGGTPCVLAGLLDDGQTIVLPGATALKTVDGSNHEADKKSLKTVYQDGSDAVLVPSSYEGEVNLQPSTMENLLDLEVNAVYQLAFETPEARTAALGALKQEAVLQFVFNYRADYEGADAFVVSAQDELFILTGRKLDFQYLKNEQVTMTQVAEETEEEMDFGML